MWFQILQSNNIDDMDNALWGHFPPDIRYNMDQVHFSFVVNHDRTYITHDNNDIYISAPSDDLRKKKFTMHVVFNTVLGDKRQGARAQAKECLKNSRTYGMQEVKYFSRRMYGLILQ